ncbi:protein trichome birefringence-like 14 [Phalaenopsis equestris]|uniref:protein trichome birefringence-like 14 n=1 Tax=Phalaenopsis equestris TaxID=78828 RepID=UPI0009E5355F|nr:protein trichome birefringence-like 14 [Phalaenopsis equestris]XP_020582867.1 protein trichome birefringence-like 14 [Phalaenopsis equestris]
MAINGSFRGLRGKKLSLAIAAICSALLIWTWEETTLLINSLPPPNSFEMLPSPVILRSPMHHLKHEEKQQYEHGYTDTNSIDVILTEQIDPTAGIQSVISEISTSLITKKVDESSVNMPIEKKGCKYEKGKWVADMRRPLYSGFECKQWLSDMWACRLMQREDFSYESYRWQPFDCEIPEFDGSEFLRRMRGKTIALVGDSLGRQQFQSLICMITGGKHFVLVEDVGIEYGLVKAPGAVRPDGWAYRFSETGTTILYYWSATLCELERLNRSDPATNYAMHLDRPVPFLTNFIHRFDVLVLNTGHHWNRGKMRANRWEMFVGGKPNADRKLSEIGNAKNLTIRCVVKWADLQISQNPELKVFFRTISPRHFLNGDWNSGGSCNNTKPLLRGSEVLQEGSMDAVVESAVKGSKVKLLDITALSGLRDEGHIARDSLTAAKGVQDCLHWCLPGVPDTWNEILCAQL